MSRFISGKELVARWKIWGFELFEYVKAGELRPYDEWGKLLPHPDYPSESDIQGLKSDIDDKSLMKIVEHETEKLRQVGNGRFADGYERFGKGLLHSQNIYRRKKLKEYEAALSRGFLGWKGCDLPDNKKKAEKLISLLTDSLYLREEIERIEANRPLSRNKLMSPFRKDTSYSLARLEADRILSSKPDLINAVGTEAETIYRHIVKEIGATEKTSDPIPERREVALQFYRDRRNQFHYVEEKHLKKSDIYQWTFSNSKKNFMTKLLKAVFGSRFPGLPFPGGKIFEIYKSTNRPNETNSGDE